MGIRVELVTFATQEELIGRARSRPDKYDVVVLDDAALALFRELGSLRELERNLIPNLANVDATFLRRPVDSDYRFSVPYHRGTTLLAYRQDFTGGLPPAWEVLWDARFCGHIWMLDDLQEIMGVAVLACGYRSNTRRPQELERVREKVTQPLELGVRFADTMEIKDALISGECWVGALYSRRCGSRSGRQFERRLQGSGESAPCGWTIYVFCETRPMLRRLMLSSISCFAVVRPPRTQIMFGSLLQM